MKYKDKSLTNGQWLFHRFHRADKPEYEKMSAFEYFSFKAKFWARSKRNTGAAESFQELKKQYIEPNMSEYIRGEEEKLGWWDK